MFHLLPFVLINVHFIGHALVREGGGRRGGRVREGQLNLCSCPSPLSNTWSLASLARHSLLQLPISLSPHQSLLYSIVITFCFPQRFRSLSHVPVEGGRYSHSLTHSLTHSYNRSLAQLLARSLMDSHLLTSSRQRRLKVSASPYHWSSTSSAPSPSSAASMVRPQFDHCLTTF
jgi:hypothetical protein